MISEDGNYQVPQIHKMSQTVDPLTAFPKWSRYFKKSPGIFKYPRPSELESSEEGHENLHLKSDTDDIYD